MKATIRDVAREAQVSVATVSRYLNKSPLVAPETATKVKKAMEKLNYFPNSIAKSFASQSTYTVALIVDVDNNESFGNPFFYQIQFGIEKVLCSRGYYLMIVNERTKTERDAIDKLFLEKRIDGLFLHASLLNSQLLDKMEELKFPFVVIGEPGETLDVNWVDIDNRSGGQIATTGLLENGYQRVAFIAGNLTDTFNRRRLEGYKKALTQYGIPLDQGLIREEGTSVEKGYALMAELIMGKNPPDAAVFVNNIASFGGLSAVKKYGYRVPDEFGLISFDNFPVAEFSEPRMTTVDIDVFELGMEAARLLLKQIDHPDMPKQHSMLPVRLITRGTNRVKKGGDS